MSSIWDVDVNGVTMQLFSVEKSSEGGWSKKELTDLLKENGIKYNTTQAHSPYVGQWGIYVESKYADVVSDFLWGDTLETLGELIEKLEKENK